MNINIARVTCFSFVIIIATLSLQTASQPPPPTRNCELQTLCSCTMSDGSGDIDLTSLSGPNGQPKFKDVLMPAEGYYYSYSPCGSFSEVECQDAVACFLDQTKEQSQQIGDAGRAAFDYNVDHVIVAYISGTELLKLTIVNLICDPTACDPIFVPNGEQGPGQYGMTLTTICACPGKCSSSGPTSTCHPSKGSFSAGTILVIIFSATLVLYLTAGLAYMKIRKHATGSDIIPNKEFWVVLPTLVVTGGKFVVAKIRRKEAKYDQV